MWWPRKEIQHGQHMHRHRGVGRGVRRSDPFRGHPEDTGRALAEVIGMAVATGPGEAASIMMRTGNTVESVAYSCELIRRADAVQYELGEGPVPGRGVTGGCSWPRICARTTGGPGGSGRSRARGPQLPVGAPAHRHRVGFTESVLPATPRLRPRRGGDRKDHRRAGLGGPGLHPQRTSFLAGHRHPQPDRACPGHADAEYRLASLRSRHRVSQVCILLGHVRRSEAFVFFTSICCVRSPDFRSELHGAVYCGEGPVVVALVHDHFLLEDA